MQQCKKLYKGEEALELQSDELRAFILPGRGGKLASLYSREFGLELLSQIPCEHYTAPPDGHIFSPEDSSGFDDMFPTISECVYLWEPWRGSLMPDHGELWSLPWLLEEIEESAVQLSVLGKAFPYAFTKKFELAKNRLVIEYSAPISHYTFLRAYGRPIRFLAKDQGMYIEVPDGCDEIINAFEDRACPVGSMGKSKPAAEFSND